MESTRVSAIERDPAELDRLRERVFELKRKLNAVIVAHNYQRPEIQDIADFVGDSLDLARRSAEVSADTIVFCGVDFMAETAAIVNPGSRVLLAHATACCPMAEMITPDDLWQWKARYPKAAVVSYVNTTAAIKAESYICCTSANGVKVVDSVPGDEILFVPDKNLGHWISTMTAKKMVLYPGYCITHSRLNAAQVRLARERYPEAKVIVHPECSPEVAELADAVLSTSQMVKFAKEDPATTFLVGTEEGLLYRMKNENPGKSFYLIASSLICPNMKKTRLESVIETMETGHNRITVPEPIRLKAKEAIDRMLALI